MLLTHPPIVTSTPRRAHSGFCLSRLLPLFALLLLTFTGATVVAEAAAASITSARCAPLTAQGSCENGSLLTLTGEGLASVTRVVIGSSAVEEAAMTCGGLSQNGVSLTCTLALQESFIAGIYPVSVLDESTGGALSAAGSLAIGALVGFASADYGYVDGWRNAQAGANELVSGFSASSVISGETWTVYGNFVSTATYKILFYSDVALGMIACNKAEAMAPTVVQSKGEAGFSNALQCTITSEAGVMGMFTLLVQNTQTGAFLPGSTGLYKIDVTPPLPRVTGVSGACARDSTACVNGATLVLTGTNFNPHKASYNVIRILTTPAFAASAGLATTESVIACTPMNVSATTLTCTLSVPPEAVVGSYGVYTTVHVCTHNMVASTLAYVGNMMYGTAYGGITVPGLTLGSMDMVTANQVVAGKSEGYLFTGGALTLFGHFDATHDYTIVFFNTQAAGTGVPTCATTVVDAYVLNCTGITQTLGNLGMYRVLVKDETAGYYLPSVITTDSPIMVFAPLPTFTAASGPCSRDARKCVNGAELHFTAENLVVDKKISITFDRDGLTCAPRAVKSVTSVSCALTIDAAVPAGEYAMFVAVQGCMMGMMTPPNAAGKLVLTPRDDDDNDEATLTAGWQPMAPTIYDTPSTKSKKNVAAIICAVIFAVLMVAFAVAFAIVTCVFCRAKKRHEAFALNSMELMGVSNRTEPFDERKSVSAYNQED